MKKTTTETPFSIKEILNMEVAPALGCTEPAAVALCAAAAGSLIPRKGLNQMDLWLSTNLYKNAFAVAIPGAKGATGIDLAAALGLACGDPYQGLLVLEPINAKAIQTARQWIHAGRVRVHLLARRKGIFVRCRLTRGRQTAEAVIRDTHDNLVELKLNGRRIASHPLLTGMRKDHRCLQKLEEFLRDRSLEDMLEMVDHLDRDDFDFVMRGVRYNLDLARHGLSYGCGLGIGRTLDRLVRKRLLKNDMILSAKRLTSAASDARMSGVKLPAMSSAGSGNHGLTAILPIWAVKENLKISDRQKVLRAIALSHLITGFVKAFTGRLSAVCGCSIAAGAGASAGVAYLLEGNTRQIAAAIKNLISDLAGVICDGAKVSCSLKLATAAGTAVQAALFAVHGVDVSDNDGITGLTSEQTTQNIARLSTQGMVETDRTILQIMIDKQFSRKDLGPVSSCPKSCNGKKTCS